MTQQPTFVCLFLPPSLLHSHRATYHQRSTCHNASIMSSICFGILALADIVPNNVLAQICCLLTVYWLPLLHCPPPSLLSKWLALELYSSMWLPILPTMPWDDLSAITFFLWTFQEVLFLAAFGNIFLYVPWGFLAYEMWSSIIIPHNKIINNYWGHYTQPIH